MNRLAGWLPGVHLNENGRKQAQDAGVRLAPQPITAIYSSPVTRCMETAEIIANSGAIAQFLDRDTRPDFSGPNAMQAFLQDFLQSPDQDIMALQESMQGFWDSLPPM